MTERIETSAGEVIAEIIDSKNVVALMEQFKEAYEEMSELQGNHPRRVFEMLNALAIEAACVVNAIREQGTDLAPWFVNAFESSLDKQS